ncbi:kinase-like domain-containing protein [Mycena vulgaris]|nr:kinase-like domain-containing protein [Mycena vulgaris]
MSGRRNQGYGPGFIKPQAPQAPPDPMVIYKNLLSLLRSVSRTMNLGLDATLAQYYTAMCSPQAVTRIIRSSQCRKPLLDTAARLGLTNDPRLREALRMDEERLLATLPLVIHSQAPLPQGLTDDDAQHLLDVLQNMLRKTLSQENRLETRRMLRRVSEASNKLPSSMFITGVTDCDAEPSFGGGYADVFRASLKGKAVALKRLREYVYGQNAAAVRLKFCQEALIWQSLNHPHILRLLGIDRETFSPSLCMVLPWMGQGQIETHLRANGRQHVQKLLWEVAQGLEYLHLQNVVHGDLKGDNILVTGKWTACLTDFGLSKFSDLSGAARRRGEMFAGWRLS